MLDQLACDMSGDVKVYQSVLNFHFPQAVINRFEDDLAVAESRTRRPGIFTSLLRWASESSPQSERGMSP